jgi:hypothetical protein
MPEPYNIIRTESGKIEIEQSDIGTYRIVPLKEDTLSETTSETLPKHIKETSSTRTPSFENRLNRDRLDKFRNQFTRDFLHIIKEQDFEYGINTQADLFVKKHFLKNELVTIQWLHELFVSNYHKDTSILNGILIVFSHFQYSEIYPHGQMTALAAISHSNLEVRECGVRSFENWATIDCLYILKSIHYSEDWLQEYVTSVVSDLEEKWS